LIKEGLEMKPALNKRFFLAVLLTAFLLPLSLAHAGLPGPYPPDPPPAPTPPPDSDFDYVKVDDARGQSGVDLQIDFGTTGKDRIIQYGGTEEIAQYIGGDAGNDWLLQVGGSQTSTMSLDGGTGTDALYQYGGQGTNYMGRRE
jgi:hypothetical protein